MRLPLYPWQRERFWFESEESRLTRLSAPSHSLLGLPLGMARPTWESRLDLKLFPALGDHRVQRTAILPATAYLDLAFAVAQETFGQPCCQLDDVRLANPCFPSPDSATRLQTLFHPEDGSLLIHSRTAGEEAGSDGSQGWTTHFGAVLRSRPTTPDGCFSPVEVQQRCLRQFSTEQCYSHLQKLGLDYGPAFQGIEQTWQGDREALGLVCLPDRLLSESDNYLFHPALLDSCFQVCIPADKDFDAVITRLYLPVEIERVRLFRRPSRRLWCHARLLEKTDRWFIADLDIYDETGQPVAEVRGLRNHRMANSGEESLDEMLYEYQWQRCPIVGQDSDPDTQSSRHTPCAVAVADGTRSVPATLRFWLLFADRGGIGEQLAVRLRTAGDRCVLVFPGSEYRLAGEDCFQINPGSPADMVELLRTALGSDPSGCLGIIHLWNLDAPPVQEMTTTALESAQELGLLSVLALVQGWDRAADGQTTRLLLVTRGAQSVGERHRNPFPPPPSTNGAGSPPAACGLASHSLNPAKPQAAGVEVAQAPVIGLGRVIVSEYPRLRCKMVDLEPGLQPDAVSALFAELAATDDEDEVALRGAERYIHRYVPVRGQPDAISSATSYRLTTLRPGTLDSLTLRPLRRRHPDAQEVEIEVLAAGLNFSDVMKALRIYPGLSDGPVPLGIECSGRVTAVGAGVQGLRVGDEVLAVAPFSFSSHVTTRADLVALKPPQLSFEESATIPLAFLTAAYALEDLAHLSAGERVLIHSASGGVGLAALQLARRVGAEVFATAGTPEKRDFLSGLGIEHVMDSRSVAFADEVMERTGGQGVDVVLNSLAGEALVRSVGVLADYGRFLEIGKRDIYGNTRLGLRPFRKNLSFFAIDLDRMLRDRPARVGAVPAAGSGGPCWFVDSAALPGLPDCRRGGRLPLHAAWQAYRQDCALSARPADRAGLQRRAGGFPRGRQLSDHGRVGRLRPGRGPLAGAARRPQPGPCGSERHSIL